MKDEMLLLLAGAGFLVWYVSRQPVAAAAPPALVPPPQLNPYASVAGNYAQPNGTTDPGDRNAWVGGLVNSLVGLGTGIASAVNKGSGPATSSGTLNGDSSYQGYDGSGYNDPYATSVADGGWSNDGFESW